MRAPPDPFALAADEWDPPKDPLAPYLNDPVGFVRDCFAWRPKEGPTAYQNRELTTLVEHGRVAVRGPHGLGKTSCSAWLILWFALTRDAAQIEWKIPTTAGAWRQLTHYLWPEVHKWARRLRWDRVGRPPLRPKHELLDLSLKLNHGEAFAVACSDPQTIEGAHADAILYVYDEAKLIPAATFDASEGAFSQAGDDTGAQAFALASSTPGEPAGRFYDIHARKPGLEDWHPIHVTKEEVIAAGRMSKRWAAQRARQWGKDSAVYANRVEGDFAASDTDSVIPLTWVEAANERWLEWKASGVGPGQLSTVGVDVGGEGSAKTVLAFRNGDVVTRLQRHSRIDTMAVAGHVSAALADGGQAVVDVIGIGSGVVARLRELGERVVPFVANAKTELRDVSGELGFADARAAAWHILRDQLDPSWDAALCLPPDDLLTGDLTAPKRIMTSRGYRVESKEDVAKRLGRSTDDGDAVVMSGWRGEPEAPARVWFAEDLLGEDPRVRISDF